MAKASEVSSRTGKLESVLQKIDNNLKKYSELLKQQLASSYSIEISGAICILISSEVEFISSTEEKYWLEKNLTPRICMVDELINYLSNPLQGMEIKNHECFLGFN